MENARFRDPDLAKRVVEKIDKAASKLDNIKICHVCGTHEWTITHYGLRSLLPDNVEVIAGPGCPVCIVPASEIDEAINLSLRDKVITCFGDVLRVPGSKRTLLGAKAEGADVRIVYGVRDAIELAKKERDKEFVFFAVGFETTAPSTAVEVLKGPPKNFSFLVSHRLIPPAMKLLVEMEELNLNGFIAPGHVSTVIGIEPYKVFPKDYGIPTVVSGFEPLDVLFGIYLIIKQLNKHHPKLENEYMRAVRPEGNITAKEKMNTVFNIKDGNWRGLGIIPRSTLQLCGKYEKHDARIKYDAKIERGIDIQPGCKCHLIIIGKLKPPECPLFMKECTPRSPVGPCMVSNEGTCRIWTKTSKIN